MKLTLKGLTALKESLRKRSQINKIVNLWMKSGNADDIMNKSFDKNFRSQGRPSWVPLARMTVSSRHSQGFGSGPILQRTGALKNAVTGMKGKVYSGFSKSTIEWGVDQLSGLSKSKFIAHQSGIKNPISSFGNIPQRKMVMFQSEDAKNIVSSLKLWLITQLK